MKSRFIHRRDRGFRPAARSAGLRPGRRPSLDARARALHSKLLVLDSHADILLPDTPARYRDADGQSHVSLEKLKKGGVNAVVLALAVGPGPRDEAGFKAARAEVDAKFKLLNEFVSNSNGAAVLVTSASQLEATHKAGQHLGDPGFPECALHRQGPECDR